MIARLLAAGFVLALAQPAFAQGNQQPAAQQPSQDPDKPVTFEEQVIVTASRSKSSS